MRYSAVVALIGLSGSWAVAPWRRFRALASSSCLDAAREVPAGLSASLIAEPPLVARLLLSDGRAVARCRPLPAAAASRGRALIQRGAPGRPFPTRRSQPPAARRYRLVRAFGR